MDDVELDELEGDLRMLVAASGAPPENILSRCHAAIATLRKEVSDRRVRELRDEETIAELRRRAEQLQADVKACRDDLRHAEKTMREEIRDAVAQARLDALDERDTML